METMNATSTSRSSMGTGASHRKFASLAHRTRRRLGMLPQAGVTVLSCGAASGCSDDDEEKGAAARVPADIQAQLPLNTGALFELCPARDIPRDVYEEQAATARRQTRALIREVQRRPDDLLTRVWTSAHSVREYRDELTVRALAEEHLRQPGVDGVPCARNLMRRLQQAVDVESADAAAAAPDDAVFLVDDVVAALGLSEGGGVPYRNARCAEVQTILTDRDEVELASDEPVPNVELITAPDRTVGVEVFKPTAACREFIQRRLQALAESKSTVP
jgi:hypothetical protein